MGKFAVGFVIGSVVGGVATIKLASTGLVMGFKQDPENVQKWFDIFAKYSDVLNIDIMDMAKKAVNKKVREII